MRWLGRLVGVDFTLNWLQRHIGDGITIFDSFVPDPASPIGGIPHLKQIHPRFNTVGFSLNYFEALTKIVGQVEAIWDIDRPWENIGGMSNGIIRRAQYGYAVAFDRLTFLIREDRTASITVQFEQRIREGGIRPIGAAGAKVDQTNEQFTILFSQPFRGFGDVKLPSRTIIDERDGIGAMSAITHRGRALLALGALSAAPLMAAALADWDKPADTAALVLQRAMDGAAEAPRRAAFDALLEYRCGRARVDDRCLALLAVAARHADWAIRLKALPYAVRSDALSARCRPAVYRAVLGDDSELVRRTGAKLLSDQAVREDRPVLAAMLEAPDPLVREFAAGGLVRLGDSRHVAALNDALRGENQELALEAARLLAALQPDRAGNAAAVLNRALIDPDEVLRTNAIYALSELPGAEWSESDIVRALNDTSPLVRSAALEILPTMRAAALSADWPLGALARRWDAEPVAGLRFEILHALGEISHRRAAPPSEVVRFATLVKRHETDERLRIAAEGVLAEHDGEAVARLGALADDVRRDVTERLLAVSSLGRSCRRDALATLARLLGRPGGTATDADALRIGAAAAWVRLSAALEDRQCSARADRT